MKSTGLALILGLEFCTAANAQDACSRYLGQTVIAQSFDSVSKRFAVLPPKGSFETTAEYNERRTKIFGNDIGTAVISKPVHQESFTYDADAQKVTVGSVAFGYHIRDLDKKILLANAKLNVTPYTTDAVVDEKDTPKGVYVAQNAFGAKATIKKIDRESEGIFDRAENRPLNYSIETHFFLFPRVNAGALSMPPAAAQSLAKSIKLALVVKPKEPYLFQGTFHPSPPTITDPVDVTEHYSILVADIQCGLVMDMSNKVIAAYTARNAEAPAQQ